VIAGNCEEQLATDATDCGCGFAAGTECDRLSKGWYAFADQRISRASRVWLAGLPKMLTFREGEVTFRVIHGGVDIINRFVFASDHDLIAASLPARKRMLSWPATAACPSLRRWARASGSTQA
jgi:hypothetical protein